MASSAHLLLPREHGLWGLLAAALLVGLPLAGGLAGTALPVAMLSGAVLRQCWQARWWAGCTSAIFAAGAAVAVTCLAAEDLRWLPWFLAAGVIGTLGVLPAGRPWWGSALGGCAAGLLCGAIILAGGGPMLSAIIAASCVAMHFVCAVPLVRAQTRGGERWTVLALELHAIAALVAVAAWAIGLVGSGIPLLFAFTLARAALIVDKRTTMYVTTSRRTPAAIGMSEMGWLAVVAVAIVLSLHGGGW